MLTLTQSEHIIGLARLRRRSILMAIILIDTDRSMPYSSVLQRVGLSERWERIGLRGLLLAASPGKLALNCGFF
jgi:hypothetical protein